MDKQFTQTLTEDVRQELWEQYQCEIECSTGFGQPRLWLSGRPRNFAEFCTMKRIDDDTGKVFKILGL